MSGKFSYIMTGVGLTLLVILGVAAVIFSTAAASETMLPNETNTSLTNSGPSVEVQQTISNHEPLHSVVLNAEAMEDSLPLSGTVNVPETDPGIIVYTVKELARQQEVALLNKSGWLHVVSQPYSPKDQQGSRQVRSTATGEIVPKEDLVPDSALFESWYYLDERGLYNEAMSLVVSADGTLHQQSMLVGNQWVNLTLQARGFAEEQYKTRNGSNRIILPISSVADSLDMMQTRENVVMEAYLNNEQYVVVIEELYAEPVEDSVTQTFVLGGKVIYSIDATTGQLLSTEVQLLFENGDWLLRERWDYLVTEFMAELPENAARLYTDSVNAVIGEEQ
jgi:hypothetical protein